jgi:hypothetical protein
VLKLGFIFRDNILGELKLKYNFLYPPNFLSVLSYTMPQLTFGNELGKCRN